MGGCASEQQGVGRQLKALLCSSVFLSCGFMKLLLNGDDDEGGDDSPGDD